MFNVGSNTSIWSALETGKKALNAQRKGLEVTGNNIANVNTKGYSKQSILMSPTANNYIIPGSIGTGVKITAILQNKNFLLKSSIRQEMSSNQWLKKQEEVLERIQQIFSEPGDVSLNQALTDFWNGWQNLSTDPTNKGTRQELLEKSRTLSSMFNNFNEGLVRERDNLTAEMDTELSTVNTSLKNIADLNNDIIRQESLGINANQLRDQRKNLIDTVSSKIDITVIENENGSSSIYSHGINLVYDTDYKQIESESTVINGSYKSSKLTIDGIGDYIPQKGKLAGIMKSRDEIIPDVINDLDILSSEIIKQVNILHSNGAGLKFFDRTTGTTKLKYSDLSFAYNDLGIDIPVKTGSFQINVKDSSGEIESTTISVDSSSSSLYSISQAIGSATTGVQHVSAEISADNKLILYSDSDYTFSFSNDTSNVLAALGVNTFFEGNKSSNIAVNSVIENDIDYINASLTGSPDDNQNAIQIAQLEHDLTMASNTTTFHGYYQQIVSGVGSVTSKLNTLVENNDIILEKMENEYMEDTGVSMDEELTNMIKYQNAYGAAARVITTIDEMLDVLINRTGNVGR